MNAEDAEGMATYEKDAVLAFPPGQLTVGRDAIRRVYEHLLELGVRFKQEEPLPTLRVGDLALTATPASSSGGATPI
jgi:ketosteroid isomerase-like protein